MLLDQIPRNQRPRFPEIFFFVLFSDCGSLSLVDRVRLHIGADRAPEAS